MLNIIYAGSPDIAVIPLKKLAELAESTQKFRIAGVLTNPPSPHGRSKLLVPTPVALVSEEISTKYGTNIPILTPEKLDEQARTQVKELQPDFLVCFAYGHIFGPKFMELFALGGVNLHPSLLPKYRGCAPVPAAILNQEKKTGVSVQKIAQQMDSGNILCQTEIQLDGTETAGMLLEKTAQIGADQLARIVLKTSESMQVPQGTPQDDKQATYSSMLRKEDGLIDWNKSAKEIDAQVRAFNPWPGAYTIANNLTLKIHETSLYKSQDDNFQDILPGTVIKADKQFGVLVQTGNGVLCIQKLQWQAKKAVNWKEFINGSRNFCGTILGKKI